MVDFGYVDSVVHSRFQLSLAPGNNTSFKISVNTCEFGFDMFFIIPVPDLSIKPGHVNIWMLQGYMSVKKEKFTFLKFKNA
jgi:hypothetical protein